MLMKVTFLFLRKEREFGKNEKVIKQEKITRNHPLKTENNESSFSLELKFSINQV